MKDLTIILVASWLAGFASFVGGLGAHVRGSADTPGKRELMHGIVAFGGGILLSAVALALIPEGMAELDWVSLAATFCAGGVGFAMLDAYLANLGGSRAQFMAMLMDFLPEAISLGALFQRNPKLGILLAAFIGAQNLPEGFNAFGEALKTGATAKRTLVTLAAASLLGPLASGAGYLFLKNNEKVTAGIMVFAAGGILYLIFQDIAPQSKMRRHWGPPLGSVLGFVVGMVGKKLIG